MDKECPTCGFIGEFAVCPNDQSTMIEVRTLPEDESMIRPAVALETTTSENTETSSSLIGQTLAQRYEIIEVLGIGGMGTVYLARQTSMNRLVAVKVLSPQFSQNPQMVRRFEKEANVVSKLAHPNTVAVFDYGRSDGCIFLVMERLEGLSLKMYLDKHGPLKPRMAVHIITQILRSLHQAHGAGIIHRDIKPANIFVVSVTGEKHLIKVLDFGVAKLNQQAGDDTVTQAGGIIGTPRYMAPEQARSLETDERADLYAVGVLLYELLSGRTPFNGENPIGIMMDHAQKPLPPMALPFRKDETYGSLVQIVEKSLQKKPEDRYENAESMLKALDNWETPIERPKTPISNISPAAERPLQAAAPEQRSWSRIILLVILLMSVIGWWVVTPEKQTKSTVDSQTGTTEALGQQNPNVASKSTAREGITVDITTKPAAEIIRVKDGYNYGIAPVKLTVEGTLKLLARKAGFAEKTFTLDGNSPAAMTLSLSPSKKARRSRLKANGLPKRAKPTSPVDDKPVVTPRFDPPNPSLKKPSTSEDDDTPLERQ